MKVPTSRERKSCITNKITILRFIQFFISLKEENDKRMHLLNNTNKKSTHALATMSFPRSYERHFSQTSTMNPVAKSENMAMI
jgi:hypothetical protein